MKRFLGLCFALLLVLITPVSSHAQGIPPAGVVAFLGMDSTGAARLYVLDLASGKVGQINTLDTPGTDFGWSPKGDNTLAFTTTRQDGGYGLLLGLRGCFDANATCADDLNILPSFAVQELEWSDDGEMLIMLTDGGLKTSPPRPQIGQTVDLSPVCPDGIAMKGEPSFLFCAAEDAAGNIQVSVYQAGEPDFTKLYDIGTFPQITAFDVGPDGRSAVGTLESAGDSGFFAAASGVATRLAAHQIHVYDLGFKPDGTQIAIVGATAHSTGDGTLSDSDLAELFLYDTATGQLNQIAGFTTITAATWSPDGNHILTIIESQTFRLFTPATSQTTSVNAALPQADLQLSFPTWNPGQATLPILPIATTAPSSPTPIPTLTVAASLTPFPTAVPLPTLTPFPTTAPLPTLTRVPSATPGSPLGIGCQYARGTTNPVAIGDIAEVTQYGAAVRFRTQASLNASLIRELSPGTRMTILSGPYCGDGYRWWQARLESNGNTGYLADSDPNGFWIQKVTATPTPPTESVTFYADRYSIAPGECVTVRWDLEEFKEVYFEGVGVTGHDSRLVCPTATTTYTLRIVRMDNSELLQYITIVVTTSY